MSIIVLLVVSMTTFLSQASHHHHEVKETHLSMYFQDISGGSNATNMPITGIAGKFWRYDQFGTVLVIDDPITEGSDPNSASVGRAQGVSVTSGLDGINAHVLLSIVFTNKEYNGSTLEIQGTSKQFEHVREVSVVSGTGRFRFARGYATFETYFVDLTSPYSVVRCNVTVQVQQHKVFMG